MNQVSPVSLPQILESKRLVGAEKASAFFGYKSVVHWRRLVKAGKVPKPIRIGRKDLWPVDELIAAAEAAKVGEG